MLRLDCLTVETLGQAEDHLLLSAVTTDGDVVPCRRRRSAPDHCRRRWNGSAGSCLSMRTSSVTAVRSALADAAQAQEATVRRSVSERRAMAFEAEAEKLDGWADDLKIGLEREIKELDRQIKEARRAATVAVSLEEKLASQKRMKALESERNQVAGRCSSRRTRSTASAAP